MDQKLSIFIEERLTIYLLMLKIGPNLKGHTFIKEGVKRILEDNSKKFNFSNRLYREIAYDYNIAHELIDRAIRHAIEVSYKRNGIQYFQRMVKIDVLKDKPSPRELICVLVEKVMADKRKYAV